LRHFTTWLVLAGAAISTASSARGEDCSSAVECGDSITACLNRSGGQSDVFWGYGEYLVWSVEGGKTPPLVTAAPSGVPLNLAGRLGVPSTQLLYGNQDVGDDIRSGFRVGGGLWLDRCDGLAVMGDYFRLEDEDDHFLAGPDEGQIIARPSFNSELGVNDVELVNVPNQLSGRVSVDSTSELEGAGLALLKTAWACCDPCTCRSTNFGLFGGYRFYRHQSTLRIAEDLLVLPATATPLVPGTTIALEDRFATTNEFNGGEFGLQGRINGAAWFMDGLFAVALGGTRREVDINGSTTITDPAGGSGAAAGGLLTSSVTNIGHYDDNSFSIIPRIRLGVGRQLTEYVSARAGFNIIVWDNVLFADDALPPGLAVDPRNLPRGQAGAGPDPRFPGFVNDSTLIAHGFDLGLQLDY
jgi:hypothetical protein